MKIRERTVDIIDSRNILLRASRYIYVSCWMREKSYDIRHTNVCRSLKDSSHRWTIEEKIVFIIRSPERQCCVLDMGILRIQVTSTTWRRPNKIANCFAFFTPNLKAFTESNQNGSNSLRLYLVNKEHASSSPTVSCIELSMFYFPTDFLSLCLPIRYFAKTENGRWSLLGYVQSPYLTNASWIL